jgi:hypothetical protein
MHDQSVSGHAEIFWRFFLSSAPKPLGSFLPCTDGLSHEHERAGTSYSLCTREQHMRVKKDKAGNSGFIG